MSKWYVVWVGRTPGIYDTWDAAKAQVHGYAGARYKSFKTKQDAHHAFDVGPDTNGKASIPSTVSVPDTVLNSLSVDAACSGNPGVVEYQGVYSDTKTVVFHRKIDGLGTNNLGEFLAIIHAIQWLEDNQISLPIYTDSGTAMAWMRRKAVNTTLQNSPKTAPILNDVATAVQWLNEFKGNYELNKWDTKAWGEIPADFGRK